MTYKLTFVLAFLLSLSGFGQKMDEQEILPKEHSFKKLKDSLLKNEIKTFHPRRLKDNDHLNVLSLLPNEVPLFKCTEESALFSKKGVMVTIVKRKEINRISHIRYLHNNFAINLPDSVFFDISGVTFCSGSKSKDELSKIVKVYRSTDGKRTYIQMLNVTKSKRFAVIWIIRDSKYYDRTVDYLN